MLLPQALAPQMQRATKTRRQRCMSTLRVCSTLSAGHCLALALRRSCVSGASAFLHHCIPVVPQGASRGGTCHVLTRSLRGNAHGAVQQCR